MLSTKCYILYMWLFVRVSVEQLIVIILPLLICFINIYRRARYLPTTIINNNTDHIHIYTLYMFYTESHKIFMYKVSKYSD